MKTVTVTLSEDQYLYLQELAMAQNKTDADVLIKALATESQLYQFYKSDADILVNDKQSIKQLVFFTDADISSDIVLVKKLNQIYKTDAVNSIKYEQSIKELSLKNKKVKIIFENNETVTLNEIETEILFELLTEGLTKDFDLKYYLNEITATKKKVNLK